MDFLLNILSHWESALAVLLVLGGLIFFHELGHFAVARLFRIGVRTFSLGFGPKLLKLRRGKTDYCLSLISPIPKVKKSTAYCSPPRNCTPAAPRGTAFWSSWPVRSPISCWR